MNPTKYLLTIMSCWDNCR